MPAQAFDCCDVPADRLIPCANVWCHALIPFARYTIGVVGSQDFRLCATCNSVNSREHIRASAPEYETLVWSRGGRL